MPKTIRELADELKVSRQTIQYAPMSINGTNLVRQLF